MNIQEEVFVECKGKMPLNQPFKMASMLKPGPDGKLEMTQVKLMVFKDIMLVKPQEFNELITHLESPKPDISNY